MGDKKQKEAAQKKWKKVLFVILAVLFVVVMVVSSMGSNWISGLAPVRAGDRVVIDYTIYDTVGNPLLTSNQQLYTQLAQSGKGILYTKQLTLTANQSLRQAIYPVQVYIGANGGSWENFALYNQEYTAISSGVVGMKTNEKKTVSLSSNTPMSALFSPEDLAKAKLNMSSVEIGDTVVMGVSDKPNATAPNASTVTYLRTGEVIRKTSAGVIIDFGYPSADITVITDTKQ